MKDRKNKKKKGRFFLFTNNFLILFIVSNN